MNIEELEAQIGDLKKELKKQCCEKYRAEKCKGCHYLCVDEPLPWEHIYSCGLIYEYLRY